MKTNEEIIKDFRNDCVFWGQCDAKRVECWLLTTLEEVKSEGIIEGRKQVEKNWMEACLTTKTDKTTEV